MMYLREIKAEKLVEFGAYYNQGKGYIEDDFILQGNKRKIMILSQVVYQSGETRLCCSNIQFKKFQWLLTKQFFGLCMLYTYWQQWGRDSACFFSAECQAGRGSISTHGSVISMATRGGLLPLAHWLLKSLYLEKGHVTQSNSSLAKGSHMSLRDFTDGKEVQFYSVS